MIQSSFESKSSHVNMPFKQCLMSFHRVHGPQGSFLKSEYMYGTLGLPNALLFLRDPHIHKKRRALVNPLFSQKSISELASTLEDKLEQAMDIMRKQDRKGEPVEIQRLYRCIMV